MKRWFVLIAWNLTLLVGLLAIVEVALRFTSLEEVRNPPAGNPLNYYVTDADLGIRIRPNHPGGLFRFRGPSHEVFSNRLGCFDGPVDLEAGEPYILAIGDSFTWGYNALESKWTSILERETGTRLLKCGVSGTGSRYQLLNLKRLLALLPHPPETVIHLYDTTDFNDDFVFPGETIVDGRRVDTYEKIRLSDGRRIDNRSSLSKNRNDGTGWANRSVLVSLAKVALLVDSRIEKRRLVIEGSNPEFLHWRYEFNLLLLDPAKYPYVAKKVDEHLATLGEIRDTVLGSGASYLLFHTNSFRLPADKPLVRRLKAFLENMPEFRGRLPELGRHLFDPHWNRESEVHAAAFMLERLKLDGQPDTRQRLSQHKVH